MKFLDSKKVLVLSFVIVSALLSVGLKADTALAATPVVEGSYANAMAFANSFCSDMSSSGVGPSGNGLGDLVWITALDGSRNITVDRGTQYVSVRVHVAGKYCSGYNGYNAGSTYGSTDSRISGGMNYSPNGANLTFHNTGVASLYIGDLITGTRRVYMNLGSHYTLPGGALAAQRDSPNAWTDLSITFNNNWRLSMADLYIKQLNTASAAPLPAPAGDSKGTGVSISAVPGERYGFYYRWVNVGPDPTSVTTSLRRVYTYPSASGNNVFFNHAPGVAGGGGWMFSEPVNGQVGNTGVIPQSAIGRSYCIRTDAYPGDSSSNTWKIGGQLCVNVVRSFNLIPTVTVPVASIAPGTTTLPASITPRVTNGGSTDSYPNTYWKLVRFIVPPGGSPTGPSQGGIATPCVYYGGACSDNFASPNNDGSRTFGRPVTTLTAVGDTITNLAPGAKVCYALSVKGYDAAHNPATANEWRYGAPTCVTVSQKPNVQVWGGDVRSRGRIATSVTNFGTAQYGSWVEYGAMSTGLNANFASGSGLSAGSTASVAQRNQLTFANRGAVHGRYTLPSTPAMVAQFKAMAPKSAVGSSNFSGYASGVYQTTGNVTINASTIGQQPDGKGKSIILITSGVVTIAGDITYSGPGPGNSFTDMKQIPQFIIIARTINIRGTVGEVNAWLLADAGVINTCSDVTVTASLSTAICNRPLVINGPVAADTLHLRRTAGASNAATANDPAEVFNLRADAYLWGYGNTTQGGRVQTDQVTEAPSRF